MPQQRKFSGKPSQRKGSDGERKAHGKPHVKPQAKPHAKPQGFRPKPKHADASNVTPDPAIIARAPRRRLPGARPKEHAPIILETPADGNFELLDSGDGEKLERYGNLTIVRPEQQAVWGKALSADKWAAADALFTGDMDEEGVGRWQFPRKVLDETWPLAFDGVGYYGRFTSFRHVGVFAEQGVHWRAMRAAIEGAKRPVKVLNLFGYTGVASLIAAAAGAEVTHVDASKKAIGWARENQEFAGLAEKPIRWICEDAQKFVAREIKRGKSYDIILLDPPAYGRGPNGEVWQLFDNLTDMMDGCRAVLSDDPLMLVLTAYAIRASFFSVHEVMMEAMKGFAPTGLVESGELILRDTAANRALSTSMFSRWTPDAGAI